MDFEIAEGSLLAVAPGMDADGKAAACSGDESHGDRVPDESIFSMS
jgi:hypothetical protein